MGYLEKMMHIWWMSECMHEYLQHNTIIVFENYLSVPAFELKDVYFLVDNLKTSSHIWYCTSKTKVRLKCFFPLKIIVTNK